ncbi:MAG: hypothetical protein GY877_02825 [Hyphomicrobium sp.]|nr:hypothetical protein [Hyphomicrobium sp.]
MRFFRLRPSLGYLALLALVLQAALAYGHTHAHESPSVDNLLAQAITHGACAPAERRPCPPVDHRGDDTACAICWSTRVAGSVVLHALPALRPPATAIEAHLHIRPAVRARGNDTVYFQARAPPLDLLV